MTKITEPSVDIFSTNIKHCTCKHTYQDKKYGKGRRVHTWSKKTESYRCTVCSATKR